MAKTYGSISPLLPEHPREGSQSPEPRGPVDEQSYPTAAQVEIDIGKDDLVETLSEDEAQLVFNDGENYDEEIEDGDELDGDELDAYRFEDALDQAEDEPCYDQGDLHNHMSSLRGSTNSSW